jgi:hypothetical protein
MKKVFFLSIVVGVIATVVFLMKRRSGAPLDDDWRSFSDDATSRVKDSASKAGEEANDAASNAISKVKGEIASKDL